MILDIAAKGVGEAAHRLEAMGERAIDARPLWRHISPVLLDAERRQFVRGFTKRTSSAVPVLVHRPKSGRTTRQRRSRRRYSLVDTGRLRRSLTKSSLSRTGGGADTIMDASHDELRFGTTVYYAKFLRKRGFSLISIDRQARGSITEHTTKFLIGGPR